MNLKEYQGKKLFQQFKIPVPKGILVKKEKPFVLNPFKTLKINKIVLKAQIPFGKRGKAGGILFADNKDFKQKVKLLFNKKINDFPVEEILIEEKLEIEKEFYLAVTLDRSTKDLVLIFSFFGGIEIEELAKKHPQKIIKFFLADRKNSSKIPQEILFLGKKLIKLCEEKNALLAEINPLVLTEKGQLIAADAKIIIDENSLEQKKDFSFVKLKGDIGVIGNGAGLVMATLDTLVFFGGQPANFLDIGGGASREKMIKAIDRVLNQKGIKGVFINIFGGITRCEEIAQGIVDYQKKQGIKIPFVVRLTGTNEEQGQEILKKAGINFATQMEEAAKKIIKLVEK